MAGKFAHGQDRLGAWKVYPRFFVPGVSKKHNFFLAVRGVVRRAFAASENSSLLH